MADEYTEKKLKAQTAFEVGVAYQFIGKHKLFAGQVVTVVKFEKTKGGIFIDYKRTTAIVSPFSLAATTLNGHWHAKAKIVEKKIVEKKTGDVLLLPGRTAMTAPTREPILVKTPDLPTPQPINKSGLRAQAPTTAQCAALLADWLGKYRYRSSRTFRQQVIDRFDLVTWLRDRVPAQPGPTIYKETVYYAAATFLNHPTRMPPPDEIFVRIAARFPQVDRLAVNAHIEWMINRLNRDHARYLATSATMTETVR
jgi:hypothetical protein